LQTVSADKSDLIGVEENNRKGGLFGTSKVTLKDKTNLFALGDRSDTLRMQDPGVILVHVAEAKDQVYYIAFRNEWFTHFVIEISI
jgi:NADH dehydrogenase FAD-containing subunit